MLNTREENGRELAAENEPLQWIDYSVGEHDAHYRVYVGPTIVQRIARELRAIGFSVNAGTDSLYIVTPNLKGQREQMLTAIRELACCVTYRDIVVLK